MELIIGRDASNSKFRVTAGNKGESFGDNNSVPMSVSRQHAVITIEEEGGRLILKNLKEQNCTYVNDVLVDTKVITYEDIIELGFDKYRVDMNLIRKIIDKIIPKYCDIRPLQIIWKEYRQSLIELQAKQGKLMGNRMLMMGAASGLGAVVSGGILPIVSIISAGTSALYGKKMLKNAEEMPRILENLTKKFRKEYVCSNCGRFLRKEFDQLVLDDQCPYCKAKFIKPENY